MKYKKKYGEDTLPLFLTSQEIEENSVKEYLNDILFGVIENEEKIKQKLNGFNSIFAVSSITAAKLYYTEFKKQLAERFDKDIKIATIYSYAPNEDIDENGILHGDDQHVLGGAAISIAPAQVALEDAFIFAVDWPHS